MNLRLLSYQKFAILQLNVNLSRPYNNSLTIEVGELDCSSFPFAFFILTICSYENAIEYTFFANQ